MKLQKIVIACVFTIFGLSKSCNAETAVITNQPLIENESAGILQNDHEASLTPNILQTWNEEQLLTALKKQKQHSPIRHQQTPYHAGSNVYGPTQINDDLWQIAKLIGNERGIQPEQMFTLLYQNNLDAFRQHNPHLLKQGVLLKIAPTSTPDTAETKTTANTTPSEPKTNTNEQATIAQLQQQIGQLQQQLIAQPPANTSAPQPTQSIFNINFLRVISATFIISALLILMWRKWRGKYQLVDKSSSNPGFLQSTQQDKDNDNSNNDDFDFTFDIANIPAPKGLNDDFDDDAYDLTDQDPCETKLDLVKAYIDMGDLQAAYPLAEEILQFGNNMQQTQARMLLQDITSSTPSKNQLTPIDSQAID